MKNFKRSALGLSFLIALLCLCGCDSLDADRCLQTVQKKYPNAKEIKQAPDKKYYFLVNTGTEIRLVTVKGDWKEITTDTKYMDL